MADSPPGYPGETTFAEFRETVKSEFVKFGEKLGEDALEGKVLGFVGVVMLVDGSSQTIHLGIRPTEAIGLLSCAIDVVKRKLGV